MLELIGKRLLFEYESGLQVIGHYSSGTEVSWEALSGPAKGSRGSESVDMAEVSAGIFFVNWIEQSGTTVSQVLDLNKMTVVGFVTFDTPQGRQSIFDKGTLSDAQNRPNQE
jgi:phenolic acid decarboxylase